MASVLATEKTDKNRKNYACHICHFSSSDLKDYNRHLATRKHQSATQATVLATHSPVLAESNTLSNCQGYTCGICNKFYINRTGLWRHNKKCSLPPRTKESETPDSNASPTPPVFTAELVLALVSQNKELQNILIEQNNKFMEKMSLVTTANTMTNSHNNNTNTFNINMYLNEQCKNAINLTDFVKNLNVTVQDLLRTAELGHVAGISSIFTNGLRELDVHTRPIHCTDLKRETVYVRDQDKWVKDDDDKRRIRQAIKQVTIKNFKQLAVWESENPECYNTNSNASDTYVVISKHALGGSGEEEVKAQNTIMKNVFKTVLVDK